LRRTSWCWAAIRRGAGGPGVDHWNDDCNNPLSRVDADACNIEGAIKFNWPLQQRGYWKNKATGEVKRV
jgi:hypothetical protein